MSKRASLPSRTCQRCAKGARIGLPLALAVPEDAVAVDEKLLRNYREAKPVSSNRDQQLIHHLVRVAPSAAGVWKPLCLGPSKVPMEQGKNARNIAASHGVIEAPNRRKYRHDCSPIE